MVTKGHIPHAWKKIFLEKKCCDFSRYNQMPSTDQRTEMGPNVCTYFWVAIYKYNCWVVGGGVRDDQKDGDFLRGYGRYIKNHQCFSSHMSRCLLGQAELAVWISLCVYIIIYYSIYTYYIYYNIYTILYITYIQFTYLCHTLLMRLR